MTNLIPVDGTNPWGSAFRTLWEVSHNDDGTNKTISPSTLTGYPTDATKFLNGNGAWSTPSGGAGGGEAYWFDPVNYGAVHDGVTNDHTAIAAAATAAGTTGVVYFGTPGTYVNGSRVSLPAGCVVMGVPGVIIKGHGFQTFNGCQVIGLHFLSSLGGTEHAIFPNDTTATFDTVTRDCTFTNYAQAIYLDRTTDHTVQARHAIVNNTFTGCIAGVYAICANECLIDGNTFTTAQNSAQAILFWGGSRNRIVNNYIQYGTTGILFLFHRSFNYQATGVMIGNTIANNTIRDQSEECISFDVNGNTAADVAVFDQDTVSSTSTSGGNKVILSNASWSTAGSVYTGFYLCFNTGGLAGQIAKITTHSNATFTTDLTTAQLALVNTGDTVVVGAPHALNTITGNHIDCSLRGTTGSVVLYGLAYLNSVVGNTVVSKAGVGGDIIVRGLNSLVKASPNITNTPGMAPSESNVIVGNTLRSANVAVDYLDFGASPTYTMHNNLVGLNAFGGGSLFLENQDIPAYTVTNPTTDRSLNVTGDTLAQVAEVVGTLITDLQTRGLID